MKANTYKVTLDMFSGPLDLLLYLIKESEVDIAEVPIVEIADQYIEFVTGAETLDINVAAEFLVMAATLMEIKSRTLIPSEEVNLDDVEDPGFELVRQLMEYRRFKDLSARLIEKYQRRSKKFARLVRYKPPKDDEADDKALEEIGLFDLAEAFRKMMRETGAGREYRVEYNEVSVKDMMGEIMTKLQTISAMAFAGLFVGVRSRVKMVALFLALLELMRLRRVRAEQSARFGEIQISLIPAA